MNTAEKLRVLPKDKTYKRLLAKYRKLSLGEQFHSTEAIKEIDNYTLDKLISNGFNVDRVIMFGDYEVYKVTW